MAVMGADTDSVIRGSQRLADDHNLEFQLRPGDLETPPDPSTAWGDLGLIALGNERYEISRTVLFKHHRDIMMGLSMFAGQQMMYYTEDGGLQSVVKPENKDDEYFYLKTHNIVTTMAERMQDRVTAAFPDSWCAPLTSSARDKQAAQVGRAVTAHVARRNDLPQLIEDAVLASIITTTCFAEITWDNKAMADVGIPLLGGDLHYESAPIGDVNIELLLGIDCYPDPNASLTTKGINSGAYFIKRTIRSTSYIWEKWGQLVDATKSESGDYTYLRQRIEWIAGDFNRSEARAKNAAVLTEVWEKPSPQYRQGRFWVYSGKTLLHKGVWPYKKKDAYPFVPLEFRRNFGSTWGQNGIRNLESVQQTINRLETYLAARMEWDCPVEYVDSNSKIKKPDILDKHYGRTVVFDSSAGGGPPVWNQPPPPGDFYFALEKSLLNWAEFITGVHDFNSDQSPPPSSGYEFELRMQEDKSRLGPFARRTGRFVANIYEWIISHYSQYGASFPRLLGIDDKAIPASSASEFQPATELYDIELLKEGNCRIVQQPGSGQGNLPAARDEMLIDLFKAGVLGQGPAGARFLLDQLSGIRSDKSVDELIAGLEKEAAQAAAAQPSPVQQEQIKAKAAQDAIAQAGQIAQVQAGVEIHTRSLEEDMKLRSDLVRKAADFRSKLALVQAQRGIPNMTIAYAVDLNTDPTAQKSAEEAAGLESGAVTQPPKPTPGAAKKS